MTELEQAQKALRLMAHDYLESEGKVGVTVSETAETYQEFQDRVGSAVSYMVGVYLAKALKD